MLYFRAEEERSGSEVLLCCLSKKVVNSSSSKNSREEDLLVRESFEVDILDGVFAEDLAFLLPLQAWGKSQNWTLLVYPFIDAIPLCLYMKTIPTMRRREALEYTCRVSDVVAFLHDRNLMSGEINPLNLFIDQSEEIYLGYNRTLPLEDYHKEFKSQGQVKRYDVISPEEIWGNGASETTDIFQIGVLLTTMSTRRLLKLPPDVAKMDFQAALQGLYPPKDFTLGVPKGFDTFLERTLAPEPLDRYESMEELKAALEELKEKALINDAVSNVVRQGFVRKNKATSLKKGNNLKKDKAEATSSKERENKVRPSKERKSERSSLSGVGLSLSQNHVLAVLGVFVFLFVLMFWPNDNDLKLAKRDSKTKDTSSTRVTKHPSRVKNTTIKAPERGKEDQDADKRAERIDVTELLPEINQARSRPTDETNFSKRKKFLQKCYLNLPRSHRGKAISSSIFQRLFHLAKKDRKAAYELLDESFKKYEDYLREHNAKM